MEVDRTQHDYFLVQKYMKYTSSVNRDYLIPIPGNLKRNRLVNGAYSIIKLRMDPYSCESVDQQCVVAKMTVLANSLYNPSDHMPLSSLVVIRLRFVTNRPPCSLQSLPLS